MKFHQSTRLAIGGLALALLVAGCQTQSTTPLSVNSGDVVSTYNVTGMTWGASWGRAVEKALKKLPGVTDAKVDLGSQQVRVSHSAENGHLTASMNLDGRFNLTRSSIDENPDTTEPGEE